MTDKQFFTKWQKQIVWLFNTKIGKWFFRIGEGYSGVGDKKILQVLPNAIQWFEGYEYDEKNWRIKKTTEFRTNNRFAYRMNTLLKWMPFLTWSENWYPQLAFGLTVTTVYPDANPETTSVDGVIINDPAVSESWATTRAATDGTIADPTTTVTIIVRSDKKAVNDFTINRSAFLFDTSGIADGDAVDSAILSIASFDDNGTRKTDTDTTSIEIVSSAPASNTDLVVGDFDQFGSTSFASMTFVSWSTTHKAYNDFTLNASGLAEITVTGVSKFGTKSGLDLNNTEPTGINSVFCYYADETGTTEDPKLAVTHSAVVTFIPKIIMS